MRIFRRAGVVTVTVVVLGLLTATVLPAWGSHGYRVFDRPNCVGYCKMVGTFADVKAAGSQGCRSSPSGKRPAIPYRSP